MTVNSSVWPIVANSFTNIQACLQRILFKSHPILVTFLDLRTKLATCTMLLKHLPSRPTACHNSILQQKGMLFTNSRYADFLHVLFTLQSWYYVLNFTGTVVLWKGTHTYFGRLVRYSAHGCSFAWLWYIEVPLTAFCMLAYGTV